jgi:hypothetical protein
MFMTRFASLVQDRARSVLEQARTRYKSVTSDATMPPMRVGGIVCSVFGSAIVQANKPRSHWSGDHLSTGGHNLMLRSCSPHRITWSVANDDGGVGHGRRGRRPF